MPAAQRWDVGSAFTVRPPLSFCLLAVDPWALKEQRDLSDREIFTIDGTDLLEGESHSRRVSCGLLKSTEVAERRLRLSLASRICEQCSTMVLCIWSMKAIDFGRLHGPFDLVKGKMEVNDRSMRSNLRSLPSVTLHRGVGGCVLPSWRDALHWDSEWKKC